MAGGLVVLACGGQPVAAREALADADGLVVFEELPAGRCFLSAADSDHRPVAGLPIDLDAGSEVTLDVTLTWEPQEGPGPVAARPFGDALPLPAPTLEAMVRGAVGARSWVRVDGFDLPANRAAPLPLGGLSGVEVERVPGPAERAWAAGTPVTTITLSGSNRLQATALAAYGAGPALATATVSGPLVHDRAWYATTLESDGNAGRALTTVAWQLNSRNKLRLLAAGSGSRPDTIVGVITESLVSDRLFARVQAGWCQGPQGSALLQYFADGTLGEHALQLGIRAGRPGERAGLTFVEDDWRATRYLTFTATLAATVAGDADPDHLAGARLSWDRTGTLPPGRLTPGLGVAWDATHDGRTVVRGSASPGLMAIGWHASSSSAWPPRSISCSEISPPVCSRAQGRLQLDVQQQWPIDFSGGGHTRAAVGWGWTHLQLSALVTHVSSWTFGLRAHTDLGRWLGFPLGLRRRRPRRRERQRLAGISAYQLLIARIGDQGSAPG